MVIPNLMRATRFKQGGTEPTQSLFLFGKVKVDCFAKHMIIFRSAVHLQMIEYLFIFASLFFGNLGRRTSKWRKLVCVSCSLAVRSCSHSHNELLFSVSGKARLYSRNQDWYPPMSSNHTEPLEYMSRVQT